MKTLLKKKNIIVLATLISILIVSVAFLAIKKIDSDEITKLDSEVFQEKSNIIPDETIIYNGVNLYAELNNKLVQAINDYNNEIITEEEYLDIIDEIKKQINEKDEKLRFENDYQKYLEEQEK